MKAGEIIWRGEEFTRQTEVGLRRAMTRIGAMLVRHIRKNMGGKRFSPSERLEAASDLKALKGTGAPRRPRSSPGEPPAVQTGRLRNSIAHEPIEGGRGVRVGTNVIYGKYMELGTRPHPIRPRNKRVLRFPAGGQWVFASEVAHPGNAPRPFLKPALIENKKDILAELRHVVPK